MKTNDNSQTMQHNISLAIPILPGQAEAWRRFVQELQGPRKKEWREWRQRVALRELQFHLQTTSQQTAVLLEARFDPKGKQTALWVAENVPFDRWLSQQVLRLHGIDLAQLSQQVPVSPGQEVEELCSQIVE